MREIEKNEIEELLSAYLDETLSERQRTEVKRLVENNAEAAALLRFLEKQKQLLNAMPTASAPAGLAQRVLAAAAQKTVRPQLPVAAAVSTAAARSEGERQLFMRRLLTAAAMLFIPVVLLSLVVWTIVGPLSDRGDDAMVVKPPRTTGLMEPEVSVSFPLSASLYLTTPQPTQMNLFIHKAIYNHNLTNHATTVGLSVSERTYQVRADRERIVALLGELATVWDKCDATAMTVHGRTMGVNARIENVRADQAIALYEGNVFSDPVQHARQMQEMNRLMQGVRDYPGAPGLPVMPALTSGYRKPAPPERPDAPEGRVTLFINIRGR
jgi:hypothetical protein